MFTATYTGIQIAHLMSVDLQTGNRHFKIYEPGDVVSWLSQPQTRGIVSSVDKPGSVSVLWFDEPVDFGPVYSSLTFPISMQANYQVSLGPGTIVQESFLTVPQTSLSTELKIAAPVNLYGHGLDLRCG